MHTDSPSRDLVLMPGRTKNKITGSCAVMDQIFGPICISNEIYFLLRCVLRDTQHLKQLAFSAKDSNVGTEPLMPSMRSRMHARREDMHETLT